MHGMTTTQRYHVPTIDHYAGKNTDAHAVTDERDVTFYFSYRTCIAVRLPDGVVIMRQNDWGPTTGRHLNAIGTTFDRLDANAFHDAVGDALACL